MISRAYPLMIFLALGIVAVTSAVTSSTAKEARSNGFYSISKTGEMGSDGFILKSSKPGENGQYELIRVVQSDEIMTHKITKENFLSIRARLEKLLKTR